MNMSVNANSKASKKVKLDVNKIKEYWEKAASADHPGAWGTNVVGLYGDDCKYNNVGEKVIVIAMNLVLFEPKSSLFSSLIHFRWAGLYILFGSFFPNLKAYDFVTKTQCPQNQVWTCAGIHCLPFGALWQSLTTASNPFGK